jgi:hypothetical protein
MMINNLCLSTNIDWIPTEFTLSRVEGLGDEENEYSPLTIRHDYEKTWPGGSMKTNASKSRKQQGFKPQILVIENYLGDRRRIEAFCEEVFGKYSVRLVDQFDRDDTFVRTNYVNVVVIGVGINEPPLTLQSLVDRIMDACPETRIILHVTKMIDFDDDRVKAIVRKTDTEHLIVAIDEQLSQARIETAAALA